METLEETVRYALIRKPYDFLEQTELKTSEITRWNRGSQTAKTAFEASCKELDCELHKLMGPHHSFSRRMGAVAREAALNLGGSITPLVEKIMPAPDKLSRMICDPRGIENMP